MSSFHPAASSLANFNDTILTISMARLLIYIRCSHQVPSPQVLGVKTCKCDVHGPHSQSHSQVVAFVQLSGSFYLPSTQLICCHVHMLSKMHHRFGCVVNFCLSLLVAYLVVSTYFLAVLEITVLMVLYTTE